MDSSANNMRFSYANDSGSGSFLLEEVAGWHKMRDNQWYGIYFKRAGCWHSLNQEEFDRFLPLWESVVNG